ncbi:E3 ubiquitin-protein ligase TRIM39-like [Tiliqua scincoides]|uniref:E3 ubiquitin-protein ligase TRIM39-like n=1 Tax=Tiliqua scincoides TaxID=71010 RepID=UPI0034629935
MAAAGDIQDLCDELTCPICLEYFRDPVIIAECGHNFCRACLAQSWGKEEEEGDDALVVSCPHCRETAQRKSLIPNRALKNVVEIARKLRFGGQGGAREAERVCEKHQEPLKLFCKDHQAPICLVCFTSREHESHKMVPQEEACQEYKDQISSRLEILRAEREKLLAYKAGAEKESQDLLNQTEEKRQKTKAEFRQIHQFLEEEEKSLLAQMEEVEKEIARRRDEHMARLCRELSSLGNLIQEMEEKCQQPASEFLQDIRKTLQRSEKKEVSENPMAFPPELTCRIRGFRDVKPLLDGVMEQFPAKVTLDPDTAHPRLVLSEDRKSVRREDECQDLPDNPERFDSYAFVLGREGFTAGRHFWEVTVGGEGWWAVGVARRSVRRKGELSISPEEGIWAVGKRGGQYVVFNDSAYTPLSLSQKLKRIRVTLDCAGGWVAFSDADTGVHIHTHSGASFCGKTLLPFFYVLGDKAHLRLSP